MDFLFPLTAIVSESAAKTIDKLNFKKNRIDAMHLMRLVFIGMSVSLFIYIVLTDKPFPHFSLVAAGFMLLIAIVSFLGNILDFLSLKVDDLSLREPMLGFEPILAGLIGYFLFPEERKEGFLLAFVLSAMVVYFGTHRRKLRKYQSKGMILLFLAVILYSLLPSIYQLTLEYIGPEYIAFFRVTAVLLLVSIFLPLKKRKKSASKVTYGLLSGIIYALGTVASLYAIQLLGVAQTMLLLLLSPALIYLASYFILKEKVRKGEVVSSIALALIVITAIAN